MKLNLRYPVELYEKAGFPDPSGQGLVVAVGKPVRRQISFSTGALHHDEDALSGIG